MCHRPISERLLDLFDSRIAVRRCPAVVNRTETAELWMAFFRDPDGNNLALMAEQPVR